MALFEERTNVVSKCYGGTSGGHWDDGILYDGVREITIRSGSFIDSIGVVYDRKGKHITAQRHGGRGGGNIQKVPLNYPREYITKVSGHFEEVKWFESNPVVIRSLKFETNFNKVHGPYGVEDGNPFTFTVNPGEKIIGFFGRSGEYLDAIGFHVTRA